MTYLDSAILVKLFIVEEDSEHWRSLVGSRTDLMTSALALPEVRSALRQKVTTGFIRTGQDARLWREFRAATETGIIRLVPLGGDVLEESVRIMELLPRDLPLRTLDALHLATAKRAGCLSLATNDQRMRAAAKMLSLELI